MKRRWGMLIMVVAAGLVGSALGVTLGILLLQGNEDWVSEETEPAKIEAIVELNQPFPFLRVIDLNGKTVDVAALKGKVVLVDFWATWCGPCVGEVPHLLDAYKQHHDQGFEIVGISLDKDKESLLGFIEKNGMTWPQYLDEDRSVRDRFQVRGIPTMYLLDREGVLRHVGLRGKSLGMAVAELCSQP